MIRRFNYTKRRRIDPERVFIRLIRNPNGPPSFDARIDLSGARFPADASVFVEAYYKSSYMRFPYGTVGRIVPEPERDLKEFDRDSTVFFRVKIVDRSERVGKLLAELDDINPVEAGSEGDTRYCILPVSFGELGQEIWRLKLDETRPVLEVNRLDGMEEYVRSSPMFLSLVYPAVIREVLQHLLLVEEEEIADDDTTWRGHWMRFSKHYNPEPVPSIEEDSYLRREWIERVVRRFSESQKIREKFTAARMSEGS
ncbi:hypothetical protein [Vitiosangium sp. GDMCC 1.1324]|uniref:hypothetical protein n=1 Tax=Vitiosangium sp. (strain GDMCC 1.1324) TaxID=2138576 RepID=UPI000D3D7830|nr:hypothetical protein [Vitiosangium sp. GDMCC 1.1324]PTL77015.1 hypothetical protein DAT35_46055 [Vitiosangium sp. GDMCC 1.1324]